ncbi:hypothetical protein BC936DRAFT_136976 [Jimgerdemannia flammicorona]|uniref:Dihydrodipicolinate synthase n=1 Tax=Jimgerdemannia flammicorona TaxID=994334 RepID=A0A433CYC1_9FUNG|nr:hypothetical protein BC936DRAFT_136976 [Jimgerdemannia flammicorona]
MALRNAQLPGGTYVPIPTFFHANEDLDLVTLDRHVTYLANSGITGIIFMGSTGEAIHLSDEERRIVLRKGREVLKRENPAVKIVAGCGAPSARGTIKLIKDAASEGAEFTLVLPPSYYRNRINAESIKHYFKRVADESPIPIIIYNFPGVTQGVDIDVETMAELARHPNIAGVKGTDGNVGKVGYLATHTSPREFTLLAGSADFFLPALTVGAVGVVPGLGNVTPKAIVRLQKLYEEGKLAEATELQKKLVKPDDAFNRWYGLSGVKGGMETVLGYGGPLRNPLLPVTAEEKSKIKAAFDEIMVIEKSL